MVINKKKYEKDLQRVRDEERERCAQYLERRRVEDDRQELERALRGEIEELRRQTYEAKTEYYRALDDVARRVRDMENREKAALAAKTERCRYVGKHEPRVVIRQL